MASTSVSYSNSNGFFKAPHSCDRCRLHRRSVEAIVFCEDCRKYMCASCCELHQRETVSTRPADGNTGVCSVGHSDEEDTRDEMGNRETSVRLSQVVNNWSTFADESHEDGSNRKTSFQMEQDIELARSACTALLQQYHDVKSDRQRQLKRLAGQWEAAVKRIQETRLEVTLLLDKLEARVRTKLEDIRESETEFLSEHVRTGESVALILEYVLERMDSALRKGDPGDITKATQFANSMIKRYKALIASMSSTVIKSKVEFKPSDEILYVIKNLSTFGEVTLARGGGIQYSEADHVPSAVEQPNFLRNQEPKHALTELKGSDETKVSSPKPRRCKELTQDDLDSIEAEIKLIIEEHRKIKAEKKQKERASYIAGKQTDSPVRRSLPNTPSYRYVSEEDKCDRGHDLAIPAHRSPVQVPNANVEEDQTPDQDESEHIGSSKNARFVDEETSSPDAHESSERTRSLINTPSQSRRSPSPRTVSDRSASPVLVTLRLTSSKHASPTRSSSRTTSPSPNLQDRYASPNTSFDQSPPPKSRSHNVESPQSGRSMSPILNSSRLPLSRSTFDRPMSPNKSSLRSSSPSPTRHTSRSVSPQLQSPRPISPQTYTPRSISPKSSPMSSRNCSLSPQRPQSPKIQYLTSSPKRSSSTKLTKRLMAKTDVFDEAEDAACSTDTSFSEPITAVEILASDENTNPDQVKESDVVNRYRRRFENMLEDMSNSLNSSLEMSDTSDVPLSNLRPASPSRQRRRTLQKSANSEAVVDGYRAGSPVRMTRKLQGGEEKKHPLELRSSSPFDTMRRIGVKITDGQGKEPVVAAYPATEMRSDNLDDSREPTTPRADAREKSPTNTPRSTASSVIPNNTENKQSNQASPRLMSQTISTKDGIGHTSRSPKRGATGPRERKSGSPTVRFDTRKNTYHELSADDENVTSRCNKLESDERTAIESSKSPRLEGNEDSAKDAWSTQSHVKKSANTSTPESKPSCRSTDMTGDKVNRRTNEFRTSCRLIGKFIVAPPTEGVPGFISGITRCKTGYVVADWNGNSLKFITDDFRCKSELQVLSGPWKVARIGEGKRDGSIDDEELVVTLPLTRQLQFFHLTNNSHLVAGHFVDVEGSCRDIAYSKGELIVSTSDPYTVKILGIEGEVRRTIQYDSSGYSLFDSSIRLTTSPDGHVIFVSEFCSGLTALTRQGEIVFSYTKDDVKSSTGVAVDGSGDVYVASVAHSTVVKLTRDGKKIADLARNDVNKPEAVYYCSDTDRLIVTSSASGSIVVFSLH